jgi:hypothetical protein
VDTLSRARDVLRNTLVPPEEIKKHNLIAAAVAVYEEAAKAHGTASPEAREAQQNLDRALHKVLD